MANVFVKSNNATPEPPRNTFDGSFVNNLTLPMGKLVPVFCKAVLPNDTFKIDSTFGFNYQPLVFPVQTKMKANLHFFYVRNRPLWRGWQDFITKTQNKDGDTTPPYLLLTEETRDIVDTGKIGDYLGLPSIVYGNDVEDKFTLSYSAVSIMSGAATMLPISDVDENIFSVLSFGQVNLPHTVIPSESNSVPVVNVSTTSTITGSLTNSTKLTFSFIGSSLMARYAPYYKEVVGCGYMYGLTFVAGDMQYPIIVKTDSLNNVISCYYFTTEGETFNLPYSVDNSSITIDMKGVSTYIPGDYKFHFSMIPFGFVNTQEYEIASTDNFDITCLVTLPYSDGISNAQRSLASLPFASSENPTGLPISALPFRAYEAIYNSFYRDDRNNPRMLNGSPIYNDWISTDEGGADITHYHLYNANWEQDVFTTAVQSPQQGVAPLVGVTATGNMTFKDEDGKSYYLQAEFAEDGHTISGIKSYSSDMPAGTLHAMIDTISTGISINDFRNVNALQRWLETNMRKGLRYKDQIESHFGVSPTYSELDMPEFIGGMSRVVDINRVTQTSESSDTPLGTLAGNATILGSDGKPITHFCDEHGWIIGILSIVPTPVYSQQLNKELIKNNILDYYFPEFAHIGFQPILNQEIAPLQCTEQEGEKLSDVFGYQRAWYEYLANVDEVHGNFRDNMRNYIINRVFDGVPQLGEEFLTVDDETVNDIFAVQDDSHKIFGQVYFNVQMKRPIPAIGVPKLEV